MAQRAERARQLGIVIKESERLTRLINQILDVSKLESGNVEWHPGPVDMKEIVEDTVSAMSEQFKEKLQTGVLFPNRLGYSTELASMVVECVTNSYMNAESIRIDGGVRVRGTEIGGDDDGLRRRSGSTIAGNAPVPVAPSAPRRSATASRPRNSALLRSHEPAGR